MSSLRVLHVVASRERRGGEVFAGDLIEALGTTGVDQRVAILRDNAGEGVDYKAPIEPLGNRRSGREFVSDWRRAMELKRLVREWQPSLVQVHGGEALKLAVLARQHVPIIYRRIGCAPSALRHGWRRAAYRYMVGRTALVIAVSEAVREESITLLRVPRSRIVTIPNAVNLDRLATSCSQATIRRELDIPLDAPVVLSLGAISWEKDPFAHLRVTSAAMRALPNLVHVFAGEGPLRPTLAKSILDSGMSSSVRLIGSRRDVAGLYEVADALLFASRGDGMEGMPGVVIEAGISGTPVVGYSVAGVPEVVVDRITGLLSVPGDEESLASDLVGLLRDDELRCRLGEAARMHCLGRFDIETVAGEYERAYRRLLAMSSGVPSRFGDQQD